MPHTAEVGDLLFERRDLRPENDLARTHHPSQGGFNGLLQLLVLNLKVKERNAWAAHGSLLLNPNLARRPWRGKRRKYSRGHKLSISLKLPKHEHLLAYPSHVLTNYWLRDKPWRLRSP